MDIWLGTEESLTRHALKYQAITEKFGSPQIAMSQNTQLRCDEDEVDDVDHNGFYYPNPVHYEVIDTVAVLTIADGTETTTSNLTRYCEIPTYEDMRYRMTQAYEDTAVKSVMLKLDTPGGLAKGAYGMSEYIAAYDKGLKPVLSFTDGIAASAAVLYGTGARSFIADQYADVGSIGAFGVFLDLSGMLKQMGIKAYVFRSGQFKGKPNQMEGMDKDGEEILQRQVQRHHDRFVAVLSANIGIPVATINKQIANGLLFTAQESLTLGLIQGIATYEKTLATMNRQYQNTNASAARPF